MVVLNVPCGEATALDVVYGPGARLEDRPSQRHQWGFTARTLAGALSEAGFASVALARRPILDIAGFATPIPWARDDLANLFSRFGVLQ